MKSMILDQYGSDAAFRLADLPKPELKPGHVRVRIAASSVNMVDLKIREAGPALPLSPALPALLGMDFAGTVEAIGEDVDDFAVGDEVYGCAGGLGDLPGALAEYIVADARLIARKPERLSMREAAALPLVGITAYEGLQRAGVRADQTVLVHGGSGGVGHVAVQLATHWGGKVFATGSKPAALEVIAGYGATAIDYKVQSVADYVAAHTGGSGFEVIFDSVGGPNMANSFEAAALNAQIASTVSLLDMDLTTMHFKGLSLHVVFMLIPMLHDAGRAAHGAILRDLADIVDAGGLTPLLDDRRFALHEVDQAYVRMASGEAIGKIVIDH